MRNKGYKPAPRVWIDYIPRSMRMDRISSEWGDLRTYYKDADIVIVCRYELDLYDLEGQVVDTRIGWSWLSYPSRRTKITIYRILDGPEFDFSLSELLERSKSRATSTNLAQQR